MRGNAQVPPELQLLRWISRVNAATGRQRCHHLWIACQQADEARDAQFPHGGPALNHKPTDAELKAILLDALAVSTLRAYQTLYQQYCNRSSIGKTYQDLYNDIKDLVKYDGDGIKSSTVKDSDMDESDGSRSIKESSRSSNSHSSRRNQQIAAAANYLAKHPTLPPMSTYVIKSSHQASPAVTHQAPDKAPNRHARTARALSTLPRGARPPSASNPTAASRLRMPRSERLTMCVSTGSTSRTTSNHRQGGSHL
jgi:hypothetical protein